VPTSASSYAEALPSYSLTAWSAGDYTAGDQVSYSGVNYQCHTSTTLGQLPTNTEYWGELTEFIAPTAEVIVDPEGGLEVTDSGLRAISSTIERCDDDPLGTEIGEAASPGVALEVSRCDHKHPLPPLASLWMDSSAVNITSCWRNWRHAKIGSVGFVLDVEELPDVLGDEDLAYLKRYLLRIPATISERRNGSTCGIMRRKSSKIWRIFWHWNIARRPHRRRRAWRAGI
jgi:hypothetical protein